MSKVIDLNSRKHVYDVENCSGCGDKITGDYKELGLPNGDNTEVKHIALCSDCSGVAQGYGAI